MTMTRERRQRRSDASLHRSYCETLLCQATVLTHLGLLLLRKSSPLLLSQRPPIATLIIDGRLCQRVENNWPKKNLVQVSSKPFRHTRIAHVEHILFMAMCSGRWKDARVFSGMLKRTHFEQTIARASLKWLDTKILKKESALENVDL